MHFCGSWFHDVPLMLVTLAATVGGWRGADVFYQWAREVLR